MRPPHENFKSLSDRNLRQSSAALAHHSPARDATMPPDLAEIISRWADLPPATRAGIVALVKASGGRPG